MHPSSPRHYPRYCRFSRALDSRARKGNAIKALNLSDRCVERRRVERVRKNRRLALRNSHLEMTLQISFRDAVFMRIDSDDVSQLQVPPRQETGYSL